jgi:hypothetical protein
VLKKEVFSLKTSQKGGHKSKNPLKKYFFGRTKGRMEAKKKGMSSNWRTSVNPTLGYDNLNYY